MYYIKIIVICIVIFNTSCNRTSSIEIIKNADRITYSNFEFNQKLKINGKSDTAEVLKAIFLDINNYTSVKNVTFRDATNVNKIIFYYGDEIATTWINCINQNQIVFGIEYKEYILDSIAENQVIMKVKSVLGVELFEQ